VRLDPKERKILLLAYDPAASVGESLNALRVVFKNWLLKYPDGHALVKDLESGEVTEKVVYRTRGSPYGEMTLSFGKHAGKAIRDVPIDYLLWVLDKFEDLWPSTRRAIEKYLEGEDI
jgi:hypothetical protein